VELALRAPALALLWTDGDSPRDWLAAGQALARVLLRATADGVSASFFNQALELAELRDRTAVAAAVPGRPQLLLRLGYGRELPATPRRALDEVLVRP
jgi:hypothetical protein